jgi:aerobic C4-dicarboxylate transport protein
MKWLGDAFIALIKMMIAPVIFCTIVHGIASMGDLKKVGRVGLKALIYFEAVSTLALLTGVIVGEIVKPGAGFGADPKTLDPTAVAGYASAAAKDSPIAHILAIIPKSFFDALAGGDLLQVLLIAILTGVVITGLGDDAAPVSRVIDTMGKIFFRIIGLVVKLAPVGAFGAMAFTIGEYGVAKLGNLVGLVATFYLTSLLFVVVVLGAIAWFCGFSILRFIVYIKDELLIVLGTSSSESVLPQMMLKMEGLGASKPVVGLVIPTGYSFNLDAFSIYLTLATVFIAQATNTPLSLGDLLLILAVSLVTSKGAHGVPGSAIVILAATLNAVPSIPAIGLVLVLSVDWFIGMARALGNLIGNCVATVVIAAWEKDLDVAKAEAVLNGRVTVDVTAG